MEYRAPLGMAGTGTAAYASGYNKRLAPTGTYRELQ
jgi:hypothetical protein